MPPAIVQQINKATGYTPNLGVGGSSGGQVYQNAVPAQSFSVAPNPQIQQQQSQYDNNAAYLASLQAQLNQQARILPFDYNATKAKARANAEAGVNPIYAAKLSNFLRDAQTNEARKRADITTSNQLLDEQLKNLQEGNAITGQRTTEDVQNNTNTINNQTDQFQQDSGTAFDQQRQQQAAQIAQSGLTGSGLGSQQQQQATTQRNTAEGRQVQNFNQAKDAQQLLKTRTFEDLARSNTLGAAQTGHGKDTNALDLARYIEDFGASDPSHYGTQIQANIQQQGVDRQNAVLQAQQQQYSDLFNQFIASQKGARAQDLAATSSAYRY